MSPPQTSSTHPRQQQRARKCTKCRRWGHTRENCTSKVCDYCQGRFHSSQNCKTKIADTRQQELVQAVKDSNEKTLNALKTWQMQQQQHPTSHLGNSGGLVLAPPPGFPPQYPGWYAPHPTQAFQYGAAPPPYLLQPQPFGLVR